MKCNWYDQQVAAGQIDLWPNNRPSPELLSHARTCESCGQLVDRELQLRLVLTELADSSRRSEPSESVKHNLRATFEAMHPARPRRNPFVLRFALAAAAILCLAIGIALFYHPHPRSNNPVISTHAPQPAPETIATTSNAPAVTAAAAPKPASANRKTAHQQAAANNDFYPLVMCDSITCAGPTVAVRVELQTSPLAGRDGQSRSVMADLLVGEDGLVRGVRVLQ
jgi:hypothetical protein